MGIIGNKQIVRQYLNALSGGDVEGAFKLTSDSFTYWVPGPEDKIPVCGRHSRAEVKAMFEALPAMFPDGLKFTVNGMTAEGDRVAVEAESLGKVANGGEYRQTYHFLFLVENGQISLQKEYLDTLLLKELLLGLAGDTTASS